MQARILFLRDMVPLPQCAVVSASDGRWRVAACDGAFPTACRAAGAPINAQDLLAGHGADGSDGSEQQARPVADWQGRFEQLHALL